MTGWIKLYRKIADSQSYFSEPFCRNMAWIDLLILANHEVGHYRCRGMKITVKRGQVGTGLEALSLRWKWSRGKVERFLKELEDDSMVVRQKTNVNTLITIKKYNDYQEKDNADSKANSKANSKADGQQTVKQTETNKNDKNEEEEDSYVATANNLHTKNELRLKREELFGLSLKPFIEEFGRPMIAEFFAYWKESNKSGSKMKWEMCRTWDLILRLKRWEKNNDEWHKNKPTPDTEQQPHIKTTTADEVSKRYGNYSV